MYLKNVCISLIVVTCLWKICSGATAIGLSAYSKEFENQCVDEETGSRHRLQSSWGMNQQCGVKTCLKFSGQLYVEYKTCGPLDYAAGDACAVIEETTRSYPECCPKVVCNQPLQLQSTHHKDNNINNEINIDEYGQYDDNYDSSAMFDDHFLSGDEISEQQHPNEDHEPVEYMVDWDTLSGDEISEQQHPNEDHKPVEYMFDWDTFVGYN